MDQYLLIPCLGGWTSIYQLFWCSPGVQGFDTLPFVYLYICNMQHAAPGVHVVEDFISQSEADELLRQVDLKPWNTSDLAKRGVFFPARGAQGIPGTDGLPWTGYGSIPINTIISGMNIHLPAILGFTRYQGFDPSPTSFLMRVVFFQLCFWRLCHDFV